MADRTTTITLSVRDQFSGPLRNLASQLNQVESAGKKTGQAFGGIGNILGTIGLGVSLAGITAGVIELGKESIKLAMDFQQTTVAFTTLTGSAQNAQKHLDELRAFAAKTPFQFNDLTEASKRMMAFGFATKDVIPIMTAIGDATSALGSGTEGINRITTALGQMQLAGKVNARDMLQLTQAGVKGWQYLAESMGLTTAEVMKLSEKGLLPADKAIQAILAGMEKDFGGMMAEQSKTAGGAVTNLSDAWERLNTEIGKGSTGPIHDFSVAMGNNINTSAALMEAFNRGIISGKDYHDITMKLSVGLAQEADVTEILAGKTTAANSAMAQGMQMHPTATAAVKKHNDELDRGADRILPLTLKEQLDLNKAIKDEADKDRDAANAFKEKLAANALAAGLAGTITQGQEDLNETLEESQQAIADYQHQIEELNGAEGDNTEAIDRLNEKIEDQKNKALDAAEALRKQTTEMIYQKASEGLSTEESLALARALGLIDEQTYTVIQRVNTLRQAYEDGRISLENYTNQVSYLRDRVNELNDKNITITADTLPAFQALSDFSNQVNDMMNQLPGAHFASGGDIKPGAAAMVHRDEMLVMPQGATVVNAQQTRESMTSGRSGGASRNISINNNISSQMDAAQFMGQLLQLIRNNG